MSSIKLEVSDLSYTYNPHTIWQTPALRGMSFSARGGEVIGVVGRSGSGKSTLLRCLTGLFQPEAGTINLFAAKGQVALAGRVGLMVQEPERQFFKESVRAEVGLALEGRGWDRARLEQRVNQALAEVGFSGDPDRSPFRLSGGQQRQVALASILIIEPELLLLDEPNAACDGRSLAVIRRIIDQYRSRQRITLLVSQDLDFLWQVADRFLLLERGELRLACRRSQLPIRAGFVRKLGLGLPELVQLQQRPLPEFVRGLLKEEF